MTIRPAKRRQTLAGAVSKKAAAAPALPPEPVDAGGPVRTVTLRLPPVVHEQLRELSFTLRRSLQSLLMEGLNQVFERNRKPPIAPV